MSQVARARFDKLDETKRAAMLRAAAEEFAERGFEGASYNQIIAKTGLSKGSLYYYFEDKQDLYLTVLTDALERCLRSIGALPPVRTAKEFWREVEQLQARCIRFYQNEPTAAGLIRSLVRALALGETSLPLLELRQATTQWMAELVERGQELGAVRKDLPQELLVSVGVAISEGIDLWLVENLEQMSEEQLETLISPLAGLFRRLAEVRKTQEARA